NAATVTTPQASTVTPPAAPSNLTATAASPTRVELAWKDNSTNEDGFKVKRKGPSDADFVDIAQTGPSVTAYSDVGASANTAYTYRVRAFNSAGGAASNDASVTTAAGGDPAPSISSIAPAAGPEAGNNTVTVSGDHFYA